MRIMAFIAFGFSLTGCGGGVSCAWKDETGTTFCETFYETSCPAWTTQVESCDGL